MLQATQLYRVTCNSLYMTNEIVKAYFDHA